MANDRSCDIGTWAQLLSAATRVVVIMWYGLLVQSAVSRLLMDVYHLNITHTLCRASASGYFALVNLTKECNISLVKYQMA